MVCVTTSRTLLNAVLSRAGPSIISQFKEQYRPGKSVLLDGGTTSARKILFVPWELKVELSNTINAEKVNNLILFIINKNFIYYNSHYQI
jgi:hypothetical protein